MHHEYHVNPTKYTTPHHATPLTSLCSIRIPLPTNSLHTALHLTTPHHITTTRLCITPLHIIPHHFTSHRFAASSHHITPIHLTSRHATPHHTTLHRATPELTTISIDTIYNRVNEYEGLNRLSNGKGSNSLRL